MDRLHKAVVSLGTLHTIMVLNTTNIWSTAELDMEWYRGGEYQYRALAFYR